MKKKNKIANSLNSADDVIRFAQKNPNAVVTPNARGRFTSIENKAGEKMLIKPGRERLDPQTKKNLIRWLIVLGFLSVCIFLSINPTFFHQFL